MRNIFFILFALLGVQVGLAQSNLGSELSQIIISPDKTIHLISPEPISYVDISSEKIAGDLPLKNVLRLKLIKDLAKKQEYDGAVITLVGESFIAQYKLILSFSDSIQTRVDVLPEHTSPLDISGVSLTTNQLRALSLNLLSKKENKVKRKARAFGMDCRLHNVYTLGEYVFLDITYRNNTNLPFTIDEIRFKVDDKKINKSTNVQSVELIPEFSLFDRQSFKKNYRNVYVFKKFTYPGNKVLHVTLSESQLSGRTIDLAIPYRDILDADIIPLE